MLDESDTEMKILRANTGYNCAVEPTILLSTKWNKIYTDGSMVHRQRNLEFPPFLRPWLLSILQPLFNMGRVILRDVVLIFT
jgi:hypothetical protein